MPRRTNLFQDVVAIIHRHLEPDAEIEESAMVEDLLTGQKREVDVVISKSVAGYPVTVAVEASGGRTRATVKWVEQLVEKHRRLRTSKLVLVSEAGFWKTARELAEKAGALPLEPEDLGEDDEALKIVNRLDAIWFKGLQLQPERVLVWVSRKDNPEFGPIRSTPDMDVCVEAEGSIGGLGEVVQGWADANMGRIREQIGLTEIGESLESAFILEVAPWTVRIDGETHALSLRWAGDEDTDDELHPIVRLQVLGRASIEVERIELTHGRLGDAVYAHGTGRFLGQESLIVITEDTEGGQLTVRPQPKPKHG